MKFSLFTFCTVLLSLISNIINAQSFTIATNYTNYGSGSLGATNCTITFAIENNNPSPIDIMEVAYIMPAASTQTWQLWYKPTPLTGVPGAVNAGNGWDIASTAQTVTSTVAGVTTILTNVNFSIPANTTWRFAVVTNSGSMQYGATATVPNIFTQNGVSLLVGDNPISTGYAGSQTGPTFNPRFFNGSVTFGNPYTPDNAGVDSIAMPASFSCSGPQKAFARVNNFGNNQIDSVRVEWTVNGIPQPTVFVNTPLPNIGDNTTVELGWVHIPFGAPVQLSAWTFMPNGVPDTEPGNDTSTVILTAVEEGIVLTPFDDTMYICPGDVITLDAGYNANTDYTWSNGIQAQVNQISAPGVYWVWAYNPSGCQAFDTFYVVEELLPAAGHLIAAIDNGGGNFTFNIPGLANVAEFLWDFGDASPLVAGAPPINHTYTNPGSYQVSVTLSNKCGEIYRYGNIFTMGTDIVDVELSNLVKLMPNPASEYIQIESNNSNILIQGVNIFNVVGQSVFVSGAVKNDKVQVHVKDFSTGLYNIQIHTNRGVINKKLEVLR